MGKMGFIKNLFKGSSPSVSHSTSADHLKSQPQAHSPVLVVKPCPQSSGPYAPATPESSRSSPAKMEFDSPVPSRGSRPAPIRDSAEAAREAELAHLVCRQFLEGRCPFGELCRFIHPGMETLHGVDPEAAKAIRESANLAQNASAGGEEDDPQLIAALISSLETAEQGKSPRRRKRKQRERGQDADPSDCPLLPEPGPKNAGMQNRKINRLTCYRHQGRPSEGEGAAGEDAEEASKRECAICFEEFEKDQWVRALPCCHFFHLDCANDWLQRDAHCPNCQIEIR